MDVDAGEVLEDEILANVNFSGVDTRVIEHGATLEFVTYLEIERLVVERMKQLDDPKSPHNAIAKQVLERYGAGVDRVSLLLAEILDESVKYPLRIVRGKKSLEIHKDLVVLPDIVNVFVLSKGTDGSVSYDNILDDMADGFYDELERTKVELAKVQALKANMAGHIYF